MDEHVVRQHRTRVETAVPIERAHPVDDLAEDQVLDEAFRVPVFRLEAMPEHRVQADASDLVIVVVGDDAERGQAMFHLDVRPPGDPGFQQILRIDAGFQDLAKQGYAVPLVELHVLEGEDGPAVDVRLRLDGPLQVLQLPCFIFIVI